MTATVAYVGNEIDAAGWRLAGALTLVPAAGGERAALAEARAAAALVLVAGEVARALPAECLEPALAALQPLLLVLPDEAGARPHALDPAERVRRLLGLEAEASPQAAREDDEP
jgi:vacuolar-type H+-ATPase subunit F/Vma7